jgi:exosortase F-associated protein
MFEKELFYDPFLGFFHGNTQNKTIPAFNTINIGNVASLSVINLNGLVYTAFPVNITGAISQW